MSGISPLLRVFSEHLRSNKYYIVKVIIISSIVLGYAMLSHYPRMEMYYQYIAPYRDSDADIIVHNINDIRNLILAYHRWLNISGAGYPNTSLIATLALQELNETLGVSRYTFVYKARASVVSESGARSTATLVIIDKPEHLNLLLVYGAKHGLNRGAVIAHAIAPAEYSKPGRHIIVYNKSFVVADSAFISPFHGGGDLGSPTYIILKDDLPGNISYHLAGIMVDTVNACIQDEIPEIIVKIVVDYLHTEGINLSVSRAVELAAKHRVPLRAGIVCKDYAMREDMRAFENEYGIRTAWGAVMLAALAAFIAYIAKVAYSDVAERMRDMVALLYAVGAGDGQVAFILTLQAMIYIVPALLVGIVLAYIYMGTAMGFYFPFILMLYWFSPMIGGGVVLAIATSMAAGLYAVRRRPLSETLSGA